MNGKPIHVLLIEDDQDFVTVIEQGLIASRDPSFQVECEEDLAGGLARLSGGGVDVVLLDLKLKDSDGLATLSKVHAKANDLPIIVLTGEYGEELGPQALKEGAQDYLTKGIIDRHVLTRSIRYAIERKRQEEIVKQAYKEIEQLLAALPSILIRLDSDSRVIYWNSVAEHVLGIPRQAVIDKPLSECDIPWDYEALRRGIAECRAKKRPLRLDDIPFKRPDGENGFLGVTVHPIKGPSGNRMDLLIYAADITQRKRLEAELHRNKMER